MFLRLGFKLGFGFGLDLDLGEFCVWVRINKVDKDFSEIVSFFKICQVHFALVQTSLYIQC